MEQNSGWHIIGGSRIVIDLAHCRYPDDIHNALKTAFGFPDDYGANWNAFWDYLDDFCGDLEAEKTVVVRGIRSLTKDLREYAEGMLEVMRDAEEKYPLVRFSFEN